MSIFKKIFLLIASLITLIIMCNIVYHYPSQEQIIEKTAILNGVSVAVRSIDIDDTNYEDVEFFEEILRDKRIVLLGEHANSNKTTYEAKSRIIRYLHERLGYNVVLYEAGLYDMWYMDTRDTLNPSVGISLLSNDECRPLWDYYQNSKQSENPILLGGFDIRPSGQIITTDLSRSIENYLSEKGVELVDYPSFRTMINSIYGNYWEFRNMENSLFDSIQSDLSLVLEQLKTDKDDYIDEIYYRYLSGIKVYNELRRGAPKRTSIYTLIADNMLWLVDEVYKEEKIIIWTTNAQIFNDDTHLNYKPLGTYIKERYGNASYSMAFTSYSSKRKNGHIYNASSNKSVEYLLHLNNNKYSFINLNNNERSFLDENVISNVSQIRNTQNNWKKQFDGVFFIDAATPFNAK